MRQCILGSVIHNSRPKLGAGGQAGVEAKVGVKGSFLWNHCKKGRCKGRTVPGAQPFAQEEQRLLCPAAWGGVGAQLQGCAFPPRGRGMHGPGLEARVWRLCQNVHVKGDLVLQGKCAHVWLQPSVVFPYTVCSLG